MLWHRVASRTMSVLSIILFFFGAFLLATYIWVTNKFETATLDMIWIYLSLPLTGVDVRYVIGYACQLLFVFAITVIYALLLVRTYTCKKPFKNPSILQPKLSRVVMMLFSGALFAFSVVSIETRYQLWDFLFPDLKFYTFIEENYVQVESSKIKFPAEKRNLVLLILESVDDSLYDESVFGAKLMPRLDALQKVNTHFRGQREVNGTGGSICGFHSYLYGLPFVSSYSDRNRPKTMSRRSNSYETVVEAKVDAKDSLYENEVSILHLIADHGYKIVFCLGADASFAGFGRFFRFAGNNAPIYDATYFRSTRNDYSAHESQWGLLDGYAYERIKEHLLALRQVAPFALIIQTANTHTPGFSEKDMRSPWGDYRDSFVQADEMVSEFVDWMEREDFFQSTTLVILGDHLAPVSKMGEKILPPWKERSVYNVFINPVIREKPLVRKRLFASWDMAPTILESLGAVLPERKFGIGTSLFSDYPTLFERVGVAEYNTKIEKRSKLYDYLVYGITD